MSTANLVSYLNDHLAGSEGALALIHHLAEQPRLAPDDVSFFRKLHGDIEQDQKLLKELLLRLNADESKIRQTVGALAEKIGQAKFHHDGLGPAQLGQLEALELLVLGIHGKWVLWRALEPLTLRVWSDVDFKALAARAQDQHDRVEARRLTVAARALPC